MTLLSTLPSVIELLSQQPPKTLGVDMTAEMQSGDALQSPLTVKILREDTAAVLASAVSVAASVSGNLIVFTIDPSKLIVGIRHRVQVSASLGTNRSCAAEFEIDCR